MAPDGLLRLPSIRSTTSSFCTIPRVQARLSLGILSLQSAWRTLQGIETVHFNTISLQANCTPSLVIRDASQIPASFYRARIDLTWPEWMEILEALPAGTLRERLATGEGKFIEKELQRGILSDALARGETIPGATLAKGYHLRLR